MSKRNSHKFFKRLWKAAKKMRANSSLRMNEFYIPVLGIIFLRYADYKFQKMKSKIEDEIGDASRRIIEAEDFQAKGVLYIPEKSRYSYLLNLPEKVKIGQKINDAMKLIEEKNRNLKDVLPKTYLRLKNDTIFGLLKLFSKIPLEMDGDLFGKIYEYFLGNFASGEGQRGGEFFTPTSIVKLIVEVIEPYHGRIYDPASGSGGMFVQSAKFVERHKGNPSEEISIFGQEKVAATIRLSKMNLAIRGLEGDIKQGNAYYENMHNSLGKFDFVMANPPFNVDGVNKENLEDDKRYSYGIPSTDNANYLWIQIFLNSLNENGRAGFVMANSAVDAGHSEKLIRKMIINDHVVDVIISIGSNFFHNVTLPCTLWFFDKSKNKTERKDKVLFIDARDIYHEVDRAHNEFLPEQIEFIGNIVRLYRDEEIETDLGSKKLLKEYGIENKYKDIPGLCKQATIDKVEEQNYSLNPGRYVGIKERKKDNFNFEEKMIELHNKIKNLNKGSHNLEDIIVFNINEILSGKR